MLTATKYVPNLTNVDPFNGTNFKRWQTKLLLIMDIAKVDHVLTKPKPVEPPSDATDEQKKEYESSVSTWSSADKICKAIILNSLSNELFDIYCLHKHATEIWDALVLKYVVEDAGVKKYAIGNFLNFYMTDEKDVSSQIHGFHLVVAELNNEGMILPAPFIVGSLIEKLPDSWKDYKNTMKHKRKDMTLEELIVHIRIEEKNRNLDKTAKAKEMSSKANLVDDRKPRHPFNKHPKHEHKYNPGPKAKPNQFKPKTSKPKGDCFVCGRSGHYAAQCKFKKGNNQSVPLRANLAEADNTIVAVVSEVNMVTDKEAWVVDSGATKHICAIRGAFISYTPLEGKDEHVYMGDSRPASVLGKGKVNLKLTSRKILSLTDVLHIPEIRYNLVSVGILGKVGVKVMFESDKVVLTKNRVFVGKGYLNSGLFHLNVLELMNNNASTSFAYLVECDDIWHARLGHVNYSYIKIMKSLGILKDVKISNTNKCQVCVEAKTTKKTCKPVLVRESEPLYLIHSDLGDMSRNTSRGGKNYYVTFIDDYSRYTKVYLLRNKNETEDKFLVYKAEVENKLEKKIKRLRSNRGGEYDSRPLSKYCEEQ